LSFFDKPAKFRAATRMSDDLIPFKKHIFVCNGESCARNGSAAVKEAFVDELKRRGLLRKRTLQGDFMCTDCSSVGFCDIGPAVLVYPDGVWYAHVKPADVPEIIDSHLIGGQPVERLVQNHVPSPRVD
jgi:(2Fe-2S) ferredoxin